MNAEIPRMDKITRVLTLYNMLLKGKEVNKENFCLEHGVSERGFDRDLQDIRLFLSEVFLGEEIVYDKRHQSYHMTYHMTDSRPKYMDKFDIALAVKLILSTGVFREDEAISLAENLLQAVDPKDRKSVLSMLQADFFEYKGNHNVAIIKMLTDLYSTIEKGNDIRLCYFVGKKRQKMNIAPIKIVYNNGYFFLIGAKDYSLKQIEKIRVDKINSFATLMSFYAKDIKNKYEEEEKNGNISN